MKKIILMVSIILASSIMYAQKISESEVPNVVKSKFAARYPGIKVDKWKKDNGNYEAEFDQNKEEMTAIIEPNGKLIETDERIKKSELPSAVEDYVKKNYNNKHMSEAAKITDHSGKVMYEVEVEETYLFFDSNGNFIKSKKEKEREGLKKYMKKKE